MVSEAARALFVHSECLDLDSIDMSCYYSISQQSVFTVRPRAEGSEESTGIGPRVLLVPVAVRQPHSQDLREAKEESDASSDSKDLSCVDLDFICTRLTGVVGETHSVAGVVVVHLPKAAAVQTLLHVPLGALRVVPAHLQQMVLLLSVDGQTCAGDGELHDKDHEEDDHVKEEQDLVVLHGADKSDQSHKEQEDPHANEAPHHLETGHQAKPFAPRCDADHQQTHHLLGEELAVVEKVKYLSHMIRSDLSDDDDIQRQYCKLYAQANMLARKFHMCTNNVKVCLFKAYCTPLYTAHLWCSYSKSKYRKLQVAYNDALRILLKVPRWTSASQLFVQNNVPTLNAVIRNFVFTFMKRLEDSQNVILNVLTMPEQSTVRFHSELWRHWRKCLYGF